MTKEKKEKIDKEKEQLKNQVTELESKVKELEDKLVRNQAETINYRKRKDEELMKMIQMANSEIVLEILPLLDDFERAVSMDDDNPDDEVSRFLSGFMMIYENFMSALRKFNLKEIDGINKPFDPIYHDALMKEKRDDVEPGTVVEILQKGYLMNGKVLRPAKVKISE